MATGTPTSRRDDPAVRANVRRTAWILASIAVVFFLGLFASRLIGDFNAENLLCALGALLAQGMSIQSACEALASAQAAPGRMEVLGGTPRRAWVVIDYAHTPDALRRALQTLTALGPREITCVFGCGGDRDRGMRRQLERR